MTTPNFSRPGAVDLSSLRSSTSTAGTAPSGTASGRYTIAIEGEQAPSGQIERSTLRLNQDVTPNVDASTADRSSSTA